MKIQEVSDSYRNQPCERCGSRKRVSKTWKENMDTFTGTTVIEYSQIICTNKACQEAFDKNLLEETKKREVLRKKKEANEITRRANSLSQANKARKNKIKK